jgi:hypothetical protein
MSAEPEIPPPICMACKLPQYPAEGPCSRKQACRTRRDRCLGPVAPVTIPDDDPPPPRAMG